VCLISYSVYFVGTACLEFMNSVLVSTSAADVINSLMTCTMFKMASMLAKFSLWLDTIQCPSALLPALGSVRQETALWSDRTMLLVMNVIMVSGLNAHSPESTYPFPCLTHWGQVDGMQLCSGL
jgi:hypothetical protein